MFTDTCVQRIQEKSWKAYKAHLATLIVKMKIVTIKQWEKTLDKMRQQQVVFTITFNRLGGRNATEFEN